MNQEDYEWINSVAQAMKEKDVDYDELTIKDYEKSVQIEFTFTRYKHEQEN